MIRDWEENCPDLFTLHGPHLAPLWGMDDGPVKDGLAELLSRLKDVPIRLVRKSGEVLMDIQDEVWAVEHANQLEKIETLLKEHYDDVKRELWNFLDEA